MTYFSFFPEALKIIKLKIGIVFIHDIFRFEFWLFGYNKKVKKITGNFLNRSIGINIVFIQLPKSRNSIVECALVEKTDFSMVYKLLSYLPFLSVLQVYSRQYLSMS